MLQILKWFNIKNKIRLLDFISPQKMILIHNFHKRIALKMCPAGDKMSTLVFDFNSFIIRGGGGAIIRGVSVGMEGLI